MIFDNSIAFPFLYLRSPATHKSPLSCLVRVFRGHPRFTIAPRMQTPLYQAQSTSFVWRNNATMITMAGVRETNTSPYPARISTAPDLCTTPLTTDPQFASRHNTLTTTGHRTYTPVRRPSFLPPKTYGAKINCVKTAPSSQQHHKPAKPGNTSPTWNTRYRQNRPRDAQLQTYRPPAVPSHNS